MHLSKGRFAHLGKWISPFNFIRADVALEDFAYNLPLSDGVGNEEDVGLYPDKVDGPESSELDSLEADNLLSKKILPKFLASCVPSLLAPGSPAPSPSPPVEHKQLSKSAQERAERSRKHKHAKRRLRLAEIQREAGTSLKAVTLRRALTAKCVAASTSALSNYRHAPSGYSGHADHKGTAPVAKGFAELLDDGFEYVEWDGRQAIYILDKHDRVIVCGGAPQDASWHNVAVDAANAIKDARNSCAFTAKDQRHRRGKFPAMARGISYGQGLLIPSNIRPPVGNKRNAMDRLVKDPSIKRIAGFQSCMLDANAPELGSYYGDTLNSLISRDGRLEKNFENSSFAAITVNFGPRTVSVPHVDHANLATGMCALTALGDFDPDHGGHLVLWDLKTIIRFPAGSTLLFPSALIKHSNIPIQEHEQRYSITQYSAGGLFRWVENGFCSDKDCTIPKGEQRKAWDAGINRLQVRRPKDRDSGDNGQ